MASPSYGTKPWKRAEGTTTDGMRVRFTQKDASVYAVLLGEVKATGDDSRFEPQTRLANLFARR